MKLKNIHDSILINVSPRRMWEILSQYGDVSSFHAGVVHSHSVEGSSEIAGPGCERLCNIVDMGIRIQLKERIVDYHEGEGYQYEVYEWKNFPLKKMLFRFTISECSPTACRLSIDIDYRASPGFLTPLMAGKMRRLVKDVLLGYRYYSETGEMRKPIKFIRGYYHGSDAIVVPQV